MLTFERLKSCAESKQYSQYDHLRVTQLIALIRFCEDDKVVEESGEELIYRMSKVYVSQYNNFLFYTRNYTNKGLEEAAVLSEFTLVLYSCVSKYTLSKNTPFYFYFNKSLANAIRTLTRDHYQKQIPLTRSEVMPDRGIAQNNGGYEADFGMFGFNKHERKLVKSRLKGERVKDFLVKREIDSNEYYNILAIVKQKLEDCGYCQEKQGQSD